MNDDNIDVPTVTKARSSLARLHSGKYPPTEDRVADAKQSLAAAKLDRYIRESLTGVRLDDVYAGHLVGLILGMSGVKYDVVMPIERLARDAVVAAQNSEQQ